MALAAVCAYVCVYTSFHMCRYIPRRCMEDTQSAVLMLLLSKLTHPHKYTLTHMQVVFLASLKPGKCL